MTEAQTTNLPIQLTSFIGREKEIAEIEHLLLETRMLTLTGSGGCGKTRLAIQVGAEIVDAYEGGVWLVDLASVRDPDLVIGAFASALGLNEKKELDPLQSLIEHLRGEKTLVIIDNCEHLISACANLSEMLLKECPSLTLMATSREPLGIPGETTWRVPSLSLPEEGEPPDGEALTHYEAVRLFMDRALKSRPNFKVTGENAPAVAEICLRLEGIPLAIELAAARVKLLAPHQISDGLTDRFHLLTGGSRTVMPRQQTLQASVDWSYQLLSDPERAVLDSLAVFAGGFTLAAAEAVCPGDNVKSSEVLDLLEHLVDKSLIVVDEQLGLAARFHLLETIRQFAMERLVEKGRVKEIRTRHMEHFLQLGTPSLEDPENIVTGEAGREMSSEVDNFRAATRWALAGENHETAVRLATQLGWILFSLGQRREADELLGRVLDACTNTPPDVLSRAWSLRGWTVLWFDLGRSALVCGEEALRLAQLVEDKRTTQAARALVAQAALSVHDSARLESIAEDMQRAAQPGSFEHILAVSLRAASMLNIGELAQAQALFQEGAEVSRDSGNLGMFSVTQLHRGYASLLQGDFESAREFAEEAAEANRSVDAADPRPSQLVGVVDIYRGDYVTAKQSLEEALAVSRQQQLFAHEGGSTVLLALAALAEGDVKSALEHAREEESIVVSLENEPRPDSAFFAFGYRVWALHATGRQIIRSVKEASAESDEHLMWAIAAHAEAKHHRDEGDFDRADSLEYEALQMFHRFGARAFLVESLELIAGLAVVQESFEEAVRLLAAGDTARSEIGYVRFRVDQPQYDSDLDRIKVALSEDFERVWQEGAGMSLEEAAAYALRGRGERKRPSSGWAALTPAELKVTGLVAEGLSNPKIAERLFISRNTVETHLKNIFAKLGFSSRAQLAGEAARRSVGSRSTSTSG